jgi:hypothetical protein
MRFALLLLLTLMAAPALADGWSSYANARYGATADIPPGYTPLGAEAPEGLTFGNKQRSSLVTVYGANVPGKNFEAFVEQMIKDLHDFEGWNVQGKTVTPDWAELNASSGRTMLRARVVASCDGLTAAIAKYQGAVDNSLVSHLFRSLKAGSGSC